MPNLKSVRLKTKELLRFHSGCNGMKISLVSNRNLASAVRDLVPTSKKIFTFWKLTFDIVLKKIHRPGVNRFDGDIFLVWLDCQNKSGDDTREV